MNRANPINVVLPGENSIISNISLSLNPSNDHDSSNQSLRSPENILPIPSCHHPSRRFAPTTKPISTMHVISDVTNEMSDDDDGKEEAQSDNESPEDTGLTTNHLGTNYHAGVINMVFGNGPMHQIPFTPIEYDSDATEPVDNDSVIHNWDEAMEYMMEPAWPDNNLHLDSNGRSNQPRSLPVPIPQGRRNVTLEDDEYYLQNTSTSEFYLHGVYAFANVFNNIELFVPPMEAKNELVVGRPSCVPRRDMREFDENIFY